MKLEEQVTSLELSKQLKELGVPQESLFYWSSPADFPKRHALYHTNGEQRLYYQPSAMPEWGCSAFTVAELGARFPRFVKIPHPEGPAQVNYTDGYIESHQSWYFTKWVCSLHVEKSIWHHEVQLTEADARAKMLIYLIENGLVEL